LHTVVVGLNYRTAPVEIRERFAVSETELAEALRRLKETRSVKECVIVATCNRTEIYAVVDRLSLCGYEIRAFLEEWFGIPPREFVKYLYIYEDRDAVKHLLRVASGLDSMVIGETQILGQVRHAFFAARELGMTSRIFNHLFQQTLAFAKRAHTQTAIGESAVSVSYAAVELGKKIFGSFRDKTVMLVGAGKMGELTGKHLLANGAKRIIVANRSRDRAAELAEKYGAEICPLDDIPDRLIETDVLISSTGAGKWLLTKRQLESVVPLRMGRPLFMIDISVPRNLEPSIRELDNVYVYDIDDLEGIVEDNMEQRRKEAEKIERMIEEEVSAHEHWFRTLHVGPVLRALQEKSSGIHRATLESLFNKLPELDEHQRKVIHKLTKSIVNQLLQDPINRIKEMAAERDGEDMVAIFARIFSLEDKLADGADAGERGDGQREGRLDVRTDGLTDDRTADHAVAHADDRVTDHTAGHADARAVGQSAEQAGDRTAGRSDEQTDDRTDGHPDEHADDRTAGHKAEHPDDLREWKGDRKNGRVVDRHAAGRDAEVGEACGAAKVPGIMTSASRDEEEPVSYMLRSLAAGPLTARG